MRFVSLKITKNGMYSDKVDFRLKQNNRYLIYNQNMRSEIAML